MVSASVDASRWLFSIENGPGPFQPPIACESIPTALISLM